MTIFALIAVPVLAVLFLFIIPAATHKFINATPTGPKQAVIASGHLRVWAIWLTGIQISAISFLKFIEKGEVLSKNSALFTAILIFMGSSVLTAVWVVSSLPSQIIRLKLYISVDNDIFERRLYGFLPIIKFGSLSTLFHVYFFVGISLYFWLMYKITIG